jgi:plasmid stabilization system protein ParE
LRVFARRYGNPRAIRAVERPEVTHSRLQEEHMPRGDKSSYTNKQKRKAEHIEEGYEKRGVSEKEAERRAWATVNKESGGGKKSGSGRGKKESHASSRKGGRIGGRASANRPAAARKASAKKAAATRKRNAAKRS